MVSLCHILNGDALSDQINGLVEGKVIICREMMMDGPTTGSTLSEVFSTRRKYFQEVINVSPAEYQSKVGEQLNQLLALEEGTEVYLWFEDDLFCQANFWFCVFVLSTIQQQLTFRYVRATGSLRYGFGGMDQTALLEAQIDNKVLTKQEVAIINKLWQSFQQQDFAQLKSMANEVSDSLPWILPAVDAHIARFANAPKLGSHEQIMLDCIQSSSDKSFPNVFQIFSEQAAIYGYGDLQAKKIYDKIIKLT